jgi:thiol:disulfide interchange protein DsbD
MRLSDLTLLAGRCWRYLMWFALVALPLLGLPARAAVELDSLASVVQADLVADQDAVSPGAPIMLGLRLRHAPHWHTYWIVPGDAGLPTQIRWTLEPGYSAGPILWPAPQRLRVGALANYGYEGEVLLPVLVRVPPGARAGATARFAAHADWLVCSDLCIPGGTDLVLSLPVRAVADVHPGPDAALFSAARQRIPAALQLAGARASADAAGVRLEFTGPQPVRHALEFFPLEAGRIVAAADQALTLGSAGRVRLDLRTVTPVEPGFTALRGVLVADGGPGAGGWLGQIDLPLQRVAAAADAAGKGGASAGPGASGSAIAAANGAAGRPITAAANDAANDTANDAASRAPAAAAPGPITPLPAPDGGSAGLSLISGAVALAGAFLGGLILNLMPCVFPVLSLKLIALVQHRGETRARLRGHGVAFTGGVVLSFLGLATLLLVLRSAGSQIGWGFQLQSPLVIAGLIGLFFLIGLNLLGTFDFTLGAGLANSRAARALDGDAGPESSDGGLRGSFATGVLAAVIASPCTAPFMGAALGFAVTQSAPMALLVFTALGAGMATPYLALTFFPAWLARLPRPGVWMERLKQFMAFPMFLTCVWLFWVLGLQIGMDAVAWMLAALVGLALFAWSAGLAQRGVQGFRWLAGAAALVAALTLLPLARTAAQPASALSPAHAAPASADGSWSGWSPEAQRAALAAGRPVFVDFTAAWCITCQANRRLVLSDERVERAFRAGGVVLMEADWTRRDEAISRELTHFARSGVPMYVLYDRTGTPHLLPEILSTQGLLDALAAI